MQFLYQLDRWNGFMNRLVWGLPTIVLLVGVGFYLSVRTGFFQLLHARIIFRKTAGSLFHRSTQKKNSVSPFQAVSTALASTIGTGNIVGVAAAIAAGGPGSVFWMWISSFFGMMTKYAEVVLAVHYRKTRPDGTHHGGPMYYIEKGLHMRWLAILFACLGSLACLGIR